MAKSGTGELFPLVGGHDGARFYSSRGPFNGSDQAEECARYGTWDRDAIEALTGFYELAGAVRADEAQRLPLSSRAAPASGLAAAGHSLSSAPVSAAVDLTRHFEMLEGRLVSFIQSSGATADAGSLRILEAHVDEIAAQLSCTQLELERLNSIETLLDTVVERTAVLQDLGGRSLGNLGEEVCFDTAARLDALNHTVQSFMDEQRRGTRSAMILLEALQQAMLSLIERTEYSARPSLENSAEDPNSGRRGRGPGPRRGGKLGKALAMVIVACASFHMTARGLATPFPEPGSPVAERRLPLCWQTPAALEVSAVGKRSAASDSGPADSNATVVKAARVLAATFAAPSARVP